MNLLINPIDQNPGNLSVNVADADNSSEFRVLLIEDDQICAKLAQNFLRRVFPGCNIEHANSFTRAKESLESKAPYSLIIFDNNLGGKDASETGVALAEAYAKTHQNAVKILNSTDSFTDVKIHELERNGIFNDFSPKGKKCGPDNYTGIKDRYFPEFPKTPSSAQVQ